MFHVKHFGTIGAENTYKASDSGHFFDHVRSIDFLVQFQEGAAAASMAKPIAGKSIAGVSFVERRVQTLFPKALTIVPCDRLRGLGR